VRWALRSHRTLAAASTRAIAVDIGVQPERDRTTMIVSVDETRGQIAPDKVSRLEKGGVVVHRYTTKDVVDANEWMLRERELAKNYAKQSLGLYLHSEPIVLAARFAKKVVGEPPDYVWVFEDDAFFCGLSFSCQTFVSSCIVQSWLATTVMFLLTVQLLFSNQLASDELYCHWLLEKYHSNAVNCPSTFPESFA